ncbi:MAG: nuclear transport factor 2 family protein [Salinisphaeraceae bacterium]|nr:nuclear transport factor 2 family protein [Salinisphaeraceae bacterium]
MPSPALALWHDIVEKEDAAALDRLLAEDVVFHSPVVHTPQQGKAMTTLYLEAAMRVLGAGGFHYLREVCGEREAILEFSSQIDGIEINGVDIIEWNDQDQITDFKVMIRPLKAINLVHQKMGEALQALVAEKQG